MKKSLTILAAVTMLAVSSCRKIEMDGGTTTVVPGPPPSPTGQTITLKGRIDRDTVLKAGNNYILSGIVYMVNNKTMKVEPGVTIKGDYLGNNVAALVITRGSKLVADATQDNPIVFTSNSPVPRSGDWGGIVICGKASVNSTFSGSIPGVTTGAGTYQVEGGVDNSFGDGIAGGGASPDDNDSSGVLRYVRIEYAGYAYQPDKEINSLTMAAVGRKTVIDYVQVTYAKDDAFEWFGGTVNCKYLIAYKTQDDDFDTDNGYNGNVQFGIILRDSVIADISTSEAFESDNNSGGTAVSPQTTAVFSNITAIGPRIDPVYGKGNSLYRAGAHIRRNTGISIMNSIIAGWNRGIQFDASSGVPVDRNVTDSTIRIKNTTLAGNTVNIDYVRSTGSSATYASNAEGITGLTAWFSTPAFGNTILISASSDVLKLIQPFNYLNPDFTPFANPNTSTANIASTLGSLGIGLHLDYRSNGSFTDAKLQNAFFDKTATFRGAVATSGVNQTWWKGWTVWK